MARWRCALVALWVLSGAACGGGSGSSGFDARLSLETAAFDRARQEGRCVDVSGTFLTVCPLNPVPAAAPQPVDVREEEPGRLDCGLAEEKTTCSFSLSFVLSDGSVSASQLRLAVRIGGEGALWRVSAAPPVIAPGNRLQVTVPVPAQEVSSGAVHLEAALLVFEGIMPALPSAVPLLSETRARFAFVTQPITVAAMP